MASTGFAQDESFYRQIFTGQLKVSQKDQSEFKIVVQSDIYKLDLNSDDEDEGIVFYKKDALDYMAIIKPTGKKLMEYKLPAKAGDGRVDKLYIKSLNATDAVIVVHYYEGAHQGVIFQASARLFFISFNRKKLSDFHVYEGPMYFHELEKTRDQYELRGHTVNVVDLNNDGTKEISVNYNHIDRIYFYQGEGRWSAL